MYILCFGDVWWCTCVFVGACMCICIYADICVWWCMCVYMMDIYAPLIGDACDAHVCIRCMFVYLCTHVFVVHVVHVCVHGASMHKCVFGAACMCIWHTYMHLSLVMHVVHMCACGACMYMWCIYAHIYVFGVHECKQVVFHTWKVALFMKGTWKVKSTWKAP